ncbi:MAG: PorV/PorQ family protein [Calditrichia bacterium]
MKKQLIILCTVLSLAVWGNSPLFSQDGVAGMPGTYLQMGVGARAMAMGNAFTALAKDGTAIYWNPAGLANQDPYQIYFMHSRLFMSTSFDYIAATAPTRRYGNFGLGVLALTSGDFDQRNELNEALGSFSLTNMAFLLSWSKELFADIAFGINYKLVTEKMLGYSGIGHGADIGLKKRLFERVDAGIALTNLISPTVTLASQSEKFPMQFRAGVATSFLQNKLVVSADISKISGWDKTRFNIGAEYQALPNLALRTGLNSDQFAMGIGISFDKIGLDYSNQSVPDLGMNHLIAVNYAFSGFGVGADASPDVFSPTGEQNISKIKLKVRSRGEVSRWTFEILDRQKNVVRNFTQVGELPEQIVWDGRDDNGTLVPDGKFTYHFLVVTSEGQSYESAGSLVSIDTQGPSGTLGMNSEN